MCTTRLPGETPPIGRSLGVPAESGTLQESRLHRTSGHVDDHVGADASGGSSAVVSVHDACVHSFCCTMKKAPNRIESAHKANGEERKMTNH